MSPPKRAIFSLNVDSNTEHLYERIEYHDDKHKERGEKVKVVEHSEPSFGSTKVEIVTKPFEKAVQRTVERVCDGKIVKERNRDSRKKRDIEAEYDTSDL